MVTFKKIHMKNWKVYKNKKINFKEKANIIDWQNGTGKSSMFEAIVFCLYGVTPKGFNYERLRNDPTQEMSLVLWFSIEEDDYKLTRKVGGKSSVELLKNDEIVSNSSRHLLSYINGLIPSDIFLTLWSTGSLKDSKILDTSFIKDSLFHHIFEEPMMIKDEITSQIYNKNKELKLMQVDKDKNYQEDLLECQKEIKELEEYLKQKNDKNTDKYKLSQANIAKENMEKLHSLDAPEIEESNISELESMYRKYQSEGGIEKIRESLEVEENRKQSRISKFPKSLLNLSCIYGRQEKKCILCSSPWSKEIEDELVHEYSLGDRDEQKIEKLKSLVAEYHEVDINKVKYAKEYYKVKEKAESFKDYDEYINSYEENIEEKWQELRTLRSKEKQYESDILEQKNYFKLLDDIDELQGEKEAILQYISDAIEYYSSSIEKIASEYIKELNPRYGSLFIDSGEYFVTVMSNDMQEVNILPVYSLSGGEKTIVAFSIILAAHDLSFPGMPLLFDESFSAMDRENIESLQTFLEHKINCQTFIITHDKSWNKEGV